MLPRWIAFLKRSTTTFDTQGLYKSRIIVINQPAAVKRRALRPRKIKQNIAGGDVSFTQVQDSFISYKEKSSRLTLAANLSRSKSAWLYSRYPFDLRTAGGSNSIYSY